MSLIYVVTGIWTEAGKKEGHSAEMRDKDSK